MQVARQLDGSLSLIDPNLMGADFDAINSIKLNLVAFNEQSF